METVREALAALRRRGVSRQELLERAGERASAAASLLIYAARFDRAARDSAIAADSRSAGGGEPAVLDGIPLAVKDVLLTGEGPTRAGSAAPLPRTRSPADAEAVRRLRDAGAVITGKTVTMEFALGLPDGPASTPRTPWDPARWAWGSSSGSAIGVATGAFLAALGTDTSGSIRAPAAACGVTGFKPSRGVVPGGGLVSLAPSLDVVGPIARTADDCALVMSVLAGQRAFADRRVASARGLRVGVIHVEGADGAVCRAVEEVARCLQDSGAILREWSGHAVHGLLKAATGVVMRAEAARVHADVLVPNWRHYGRGTRAVLAAGRSVTGRAESRARALLGLDVAGAPPAEEVVFAGHHVLLAPTLVCPPPLAQELAFTSLRDDLYTQAWSGLGLPAVSLPGPPAPGGMPTAVQIIGRRGADRQVLGVAALIQSRTGHHLARPPATPGAPGDDVVTRPGAAAEHCSPRSDFDAWLSRQPELAAMVDGDDRALMNAVYVSIAADERRLNETDVIG